MSLQMSHHASLLLQQGPDPLQGRTDLLAQRTELESLDGGGCSHSADKVMATLPPEEGLQLRCRSGTR
ncbi:hypothetical protein I79_002049 [Cricetulus griseus]|uniref:Uncharacterized protein n=1 Tax=Cricetulus griseus TaxID=10029 RepID=G3GWC8_CRIGR|nr:hypothetical protein I79_002049 [Cricetulus griseus]